MSRTATTVSQTRIFDGSPTEIRNVRQFISQFVDGCPVADAAILLASELATNAILHTASGAGGTFSVLVRVEGVLVRVEVHDLGSATRPAVSRPGSSAESGRGLGLVEAIADRWGFQGSQHGRVVWFEIGAGRGATSSGNQPATLYRCSCEFISGDADDFGDHLRIECAAADDIGLDGCQHYELASSATGRPDRDCLAARACACGFAAGDLAALDDHLLDVFLTPEVVGADGRPHGLVSLTVSGT